MQKNMWAFQGKGKYIWAFKMSISRITTHRFDFFMGHARSIIVLLLLYYVWKTLSAPNGTFAGLTAAELTTYVFLASLMRRLLFGADTRRVSFDINEGRFSVFLMRPVNHFFFTYCEEFSERIVQVLSSLVEMFIIGLVLRIDFFVPSALSAWLFFFSAAFLAHILFFTMTYAMSLISFWSREAMGPRFLFDWFVDFAAGSYFPLHILSGIFWKITLFLPFMYLIYAPIMIYLGKITPAHSGKILLIQLVSIAIVGLVTNMLWKKGLQQYSGEGI